MDARARLVAAIRALRERRYREAWPLYEARRELPWVDVRRPITGAAEWRGEDLTGKRIVVCTEQGFGDQLMFGRYLPLLAGAQVVVACNTPAMGRLFGSAGFEAAPFLPDRPIPPSDYWVPMGSLPLRLGGPIPAPTWLSLPVGSGVGIGVMASGSPKHRNDANRSLDAASAVQLGALGRDLSREAIGASDFYDVAEVIAGLDLIITVDTATAHLAGALGKLCWVLLPREMDFRWNDGIKSDWYPEARLFRQSVAGDWASVLAEVRIALASVQRKGPAAREGVDRVAARRGDCPARGSLRTGIADDHHT